MSDASFRAVVRARRLLSENKCPYCERELQPHGASAQADPTPGSINTTITQALDHIESLIAELSLRGIDIDNNDEAIAARKFFDKTYAAMQRKPMA